MNCSRDLIYLVELDGHNMYDRFETIRAIIRQAMGTDEPEEINKHYAEILFNMMLMKISLYIDEDTDSCHLFSDYQGFLGFIRDAIDYIKERYTEISGRDVIREAASMDFLHQHYEEYMAHHEQA